MSMICGLVSALEPGCAGETGAIEVSLIDLLHPRLPGFSLQAKLSVTTVERERLRPWLVKMID